MAHAAGYSFLDASDLPAPLSVKEYLENRDPALQATLDYRVKG